MSLRFDASGDILSRTTSLPSITAWTIMGWFKITTDRNAFSAFFNFGHATNSLATYTIQTSSDGTTLNLWDGDTNTTGTNLTVGTWYHIAAVCDGTGAGNVRIYLNGVLDITASGDTDPTAGKIWFGNDVDAEWLNGPMAGLKVYSAALTQAEIANEARQLMPYRTANLNAWHPCVDRTTSDNALDRSGNGNNLTVGGTLAVEDGPPVPWSQRRSRKVYVPSGGGTTFTQSLSTTGTGSGALARQAQKAPTGTGTGTGALARAASKAIAGTGSGTGALAKLAAKALTGAGSGTGAAVVKAVSKTLATAGAGLGAVAKAVSKSIAGGGSGSGVLSSLVVFLKTLTGTGTGSGVLTRQAQKAIAGAGAGAGTLARAVAKGLATTGAGAGSLTAQLISGGGSAAAWFYRNILIGWRRRR